MVEVIDLFLVIIDVGTGFEDVVRDLGEVLRRNLKDFKVVVKGLEVVLFSEKLLDNTKEETLDLRRIRLRRRLAFFKDKRVEVNSLLVTMVFGVKFSEVFK